ncbi:MAG: MCE family protein [Candidatus Sumerlaeia bacterium]|nr:MCE family protein [Candidatus Sumerlaeia bacterium]
MSHQIQSRRGAVHKILLALVFGVVVASVVAILMFGRNPSGTFFVVTFADVQGLSEGDPVTLDRTQIGEVGNITQAAGVDAHWEVTLLIDPDHSHSVTSKSSARIIRSGILNRATEVRILNHADGGSPIRPGAVVQGVESSVEEQLFLGGEAARRGMDQLKEGWGNLSARLGESMEGARDWFSSPEAQNIRDRMESLRQDIQEFTVARAGEASEKMQETLAKGRELVTDLRDLGRDDLADEVSESLDTMTEQYEEAMEAEPGDE